MLQPKKSCEPLMEYGLRFTNLILNVLQLNTVDFCFQELSYLRGDNCMLLTHRP